MPEDGVKFQPRDQILTLRRNRAIRARRRDPRRPQTPRHRRRAAAAQGSCAARSGSWRPSKEFEDLALTTNGVLLADQAPGTLRRRLAPHQRASGYARPRAIQTASPGATTSTKCWRASTWRSASAIGPIKINAVAVKNLVEPDIVPLARFGRERDIEIRYIEFMPLDAQGMWDRGRVLLADDMIAMLTREIGALRRNSRSRPARSRDRIRFRGWHRPHRLHRLRQPPVLPELQSHPPDRRRQIPLLPVRHRRDRHARASARRRIRRRNSRGHSRLGEG